MASQGCAGHEKVSLLNMSFKVSMVHYIIMKIKGEFAHADVGNSKLGPHSVWFLFEHPLFAFEARRINRNSPFCLIPRLANVEIRHGRNMYRVEWVIQLVVKRARHQRNRNRNRNGKGMEPKGVVGGVIILIMIFIVVAGNSEFRMACT